MRVVWVSCISRATTVALTAVAALACHKAPVTVSEPMLGHNRIGSLEIVEDDLPPTNLTKVKPEDLARHIEAIYRLKPDRRFLAAVSGVRTLLGGKPDAVFVRHVAGGGWRVSMGQEMVGQLPELPSFSDGLTFVREWAAREWRVRGAGKSRRADPAEVAQLDRRTWHGTYLEHLQTLKRANALAGEAPQDPALLRVAGETLLAVGLETQDWTEMLDPALGRAMALLAVSETCSGAPVGAQSLSVLAAELGYWNEAVDLAVSLDAADPWLAFVNGDVARLKTLAATGKDPFVAVLTIKSLALHGTDDEALEVGRAAGLMNPSSFTFLAGMVAMRSMSLQPGVDEALATEAFRLVVGTRLPTGEARRPSVTQRARQVWDRLRKRERPVLPVEGRTREFEAGVAWQAARMGGPLVDEATVAGILRAPLYAGLLAKTQYYLDQFGSTPPAARIAAAIVDPQPGAATELKRWIEDRVAVRDAAPGATERAAHDIGALRCLGVFPPYRLIWSVASSLKLWWDPVARRPIRWMYDGMDTRTSHLVAASVLGGNLLWDVRTWQHYARAAAQRNPSALEGPQLDFVVANESDTGLLWRMANRVDLGPVTRAKVLERLAVVAPDHVAAVVTSLHTLADGTGPEQSGAVVESLVAVLDGLGRGGEADRVIDDWLTTKGPYAGLTNEALQAFKAGRLRRLGRLREAWETIEPAIASWKGDCLEEATRILLAMKRPAAALKVGEMATERYPDVSSGHALVAEALWQLGRPEDAAVRLKDGLKGRSGRLWSEDVASALVRAFPGPEMTGAVAAVSELFRVGVDAPSLRELALGIGGQGNHRLAAVLFSELVSVHPAKDQTILEAFEELREADGADAAFAWLRGHIPVLTDPIIIVAYSLGADDIVWDYPGQRVGRDKSFIWVLLRSAAYARSSNPKPEQRAVVLDYCRHQAEGTMYSVYPRYMLGEADDRALLAFAKDASSICTIAWMIGSRKASEGRVAEAADWFQVAMETGDTAQPPYSMSYMLMAKWTGTKKLMENLATERVLF